MLKLFVVQDNRMCVTLSFIIIPYAKIFSVVSLVRLATSTYVLETKMNVEINSTSVIVSRAVQQRYYQLPSFVASLCFTE